MLSVIVLIICTYRTNLPLYVVNVVDCVPTLRRSVKEVSIFDVKTSKFKYLIRKRKLEVVMSDKCINPSLVPTLVVSKTPPTAHNGQQFQPVLAATQRKTKY